MNFSSEPGERQRRCFQRNPLLKGLGGKALSEGGEAGLKSVAELEVVRFPHSPAASCFLGCFTSTLSNSQLGPPCTRPAMGITASFVEQPCLGLHKTSQCETKQTKALDSPGKAIY